MPTEIITGKGTKLPADLMKRAEHLWQKLREPDHTGTQRAARLDASATQTDDDAEPAGYSML